MIERGRKLDLWGALSSLLWFHYAYAKKKEGGSNDEIVNEVIKENPNREGGGEAYEIYKVIKDIDALIDRFSNYKVEYLKIENFKSLVGRMHAHFLNELGKRERPNNETTSVVFSIENDILKYQGNTLDVSVPRDTRYYFLLKTLLSSPKKLWNYDELWKELNEDDNYDPKDWKKIYNPAHDLNEKIAQETTIADFLDVKKSTIRIDPKYLN
jgi:hypothetical protein